MYRYIYIYIQISGFRVYGSGFMGFGYILLAISPGWSDGVRRTPVRVRSEDDADSLNSASKHHGDPRFEKFPGALTRLQVSCCLQAVISIGWSACYGHGARSKNPSQRALLQMAFHACLCCVIFSTYVSKFVQAQLEPSDYRLVGVLVHVGECHALANAVWG